jgi:hypothetical protein
MHPDADAAKHVMELVLKGAGADDIRKEAWATKKRLTEENWALWRAITLMDQIVINYAPDASWQFGWVQDPQAVAAAQVGVQGVKPSSDRAARVISIATGMVNQGAKTVTSKAIGDRLRLEGDEASSKDLATGAGNVLARAEGWRKVRPGEYAPVAIQKEMPAV